MLSGLLSRFGVKRKPNFTPRTIERTHWFVSQPLHAVNFEDKAWAMQWCEQHGLPTTAVQEHTATLDAENAITKANALDNMFERIAAGHHMGSLATIAPDTPTTHLDKFFDSFKAQPEISASSPLLSMAFAVNRVDVAQYLGALLEKSFAHWETPIENIPYQDPEIVENANKAFLEGFKELMFKPRQMQWLMEHNPALLEKMKIPENFSRLESSIFHFAPPHQKVTWPSNFSSPHQKVMWPLLASTVFNKQADPTAIQWPIDSPDLFNMLLLSFANDPAAQCTLVHQARLNDWFMEHESMTVSLQTASPFVAPEAIVLRQHLQQDPQPTNNADLDTRVSLLEMILDENTKTEEFYQHALAVLSPTPKMELALPELDFTT